MKKLFAVLAACTILFTTLGSVAVHATDPTADTAEPTALTNAADSTPAQASEVKTENSTAAQKEALQGQLADLQKTYDDLSKRQTAIKSIIANASSLKNQQIAVRNNIDEQISITVAQIQLLQEKITLLEEAIALTEQNISDTEARIAEVEAAIDEKETDIRTKQEEYDTAYKTFLDRIRVYYMQGDKTALELMLSAESFSDMVLSNEAQRRIVEHDRKVMSELVAQRKVMEAALKGIEADRAELRDARAELEATKNDQKEQYQTLEDSKGEVELMKAELDDQRAVADALVNDYASQEYKAKVEQAEILKAMQAAKADMDKVFSEMVKLSKLAEYVGGVFQWPLPGYSMITSSFGESRGYYSGGRWVNDIHTGTDISGSGVYGKPIIASNAGIVYKVEQSNWGYGNYIIIDHGGGYSTLYAHCSSLAVQQDQTVIKGDVIGYVGSSGNSTGPHLHFEVRIDGKAVNPMQYFTRG